jgi:DNA-binding MarR family transcriptional regulator
LKLLVATNIVLKYISTMRRGKPTKPIQTPQQATFINLLQTHRHLVGGLNEVLKSHGLSEPQFNVLRILRGAGNDGLPCQGIAERMLTRVPDVTRLLDRLAALGLVARKRSDMDRRVVIVSMTDEGLERLQLLDEPVLEIHNQQFGQLTTTELYELNRLLVKVRRSSTPQRPEETRTRSDT